MIILTMREAGLGSQMLQYAMVKSLAYDNQFEFKIDTRRVNDPTSEAYHNGYELDTVFNLDDIASKQDIANLNKKLFWQRLIRAIGVKFKQFRKIPTPNLIKEKGLEYEKIDIKDNSFLEGFWVSYRYYYHNIDVIRRCFSFQEPADDLNRHYAKMIGECNAVSLHVRRGDYVTNQGFFEIVGVCSLDYYRNALKLIFEKVVNPVFFVFSDDIEWCKENLPLSNVEAHYLDHNKNDKSYLDMYLMSLCKHNIIANSSFSMWGAMLNSNPDKIVICPDKWSNTDVVKSRDICLPDWNFV